MRLDFADVEVFIAIGSQFLQRGEYCAQQGAALRILATRLMNDCQRRGDIEIAFVDHRWIGEQVRQGLDKQLSSTVQVSGFSNRSRRATSVSQASPRFGA